MEFKKTRLDKPNKNKRVIYITYCGRFCIGWYIEDEFIEYRTNIKTTNEMVLYWSYEDDITPKDFDNEKKACGW